MNATKLPRTPQPFPITLNRFKRSKPKLISIYYTWPLFKSPYSFFTEHGLLSQQERQLFLNFYESVRDTVDFAYCEAKAKGFNISYFLSERKKLKTSLLEPIELYKEALFIINLCVEFSAQQRELLRSGKL